MIDTDFFDWFDGMADDYIQPKKGKKMIDTTERPVKQSYGDSAGNGKDLAEKMANRLKSTSENDLGSTLAARVELDHYPILTISSKYGWIWYVCPKISNVRYATLTPLQVLIKKASKIS